MHQQPMHHAIHARTAAGQLKRVFGGGVELSRSRGRTFARRRPHRRLGYAHHLRCIHLPRDGGASQLPTPVVAERPHVPRISDDYGVGRAPRDRLDAAGERVAESKRTGRKRCADPALPRLSEYTPVLSRVPLVHKAICTCQHAQVEWEGT